MFTTTALVQGRGCGLNLNRSVHKHTGLSCRQSLIWEQQVMFMQSCVSECLCGSLFPFFAPWVIYVHPYACEVIQNNIAFASK